MSVTRTFISACTGQPFSAPVLNRPETQRYQTLMAHVNAAAREYDGSRLRRAELLRAMDKINIFVKNRVGSAHLQHAADLASDLADAFAHQARPGNNAVFSLDVIYKEARARLRGEPDRESNFPGLMRSMNFYDTKKEMRTSFPATGPKTPDARYQPKFASLIDELCDHDIGLEDIVISTPPSSHPRELRDSYVILKLRNPRLQIAVCDREDMPTYLSETHEAEFWKDEDTKLIRSGNPDALCAALRIRIGGGKPAPYHALNGHGADGKSEGAASIIPFARKEIKVIAPATLPLSKRELNEKKRIEKINADIIGYALEKGRWPHTSLDEPPRYPKQLWTAHDCWIRYHFKSSLLGYTDTLVRSWGEEHEHRTGTKAGPRSGAIPSTDGLTWEIVYNCYRANRLNKRNLESLGIEPLETPEKQTKRERIDAALVKWAASGTPEKEAGGKKEKSPDAVSPGLGTSTNLIRVVPDTGSITQTVQATTVEEELFYSSTDVPSTESIIQDVLSYAVKKKHFPSVKPVTHKNDPVPLWNSHEEWLLNNQGISLSRFIIAWTREQASTYAEQHEGRQPDETSGPLPGHPQYDWALLDRCFQAYPNKPTLRKILTPAAAAPAPVSAPATPFTPG